MGVDADADSGRGCGLLGLGSGRGGGGEPDPVEKALERSVPPSSAMSIAMLLGGVGKIDEAVLSLFKSNIMSYAADAGSVAVGSR
jgi:hypothetical protein